MTANSCRFNLAPAWSGPKAAPKRQEQQQHHHQGTNGERPNKISSISSGSIGAGSSCNSTSSTSRRGATSKSGANKDQMANKSDEQLKQSSRGRRTTTKTTTTTTATTATTTLATPSAPLARSALIKRLICLQTLIVLVARNLQQASLPTQTDSPLVLLAQAHVVLTRDDYSSSLVLSGEDGKGGGGEGGDQLVIAGSNMGGGGGGAGGQDSRMIMQNANEREGDIVMSGRSMIIPGEDGHIVLADSRGGQQEEGIRRTLPMGESPLMMWLPYMGNRFGYLRMMPFFG